MSHGPKTQSLIETLDGLVSRLRSHGEEHWASWLDSDRERLQRGDFAGIRHFLSAFGGMGSVNDLVLHPINGHTLTLANVDRENEWLSQQLSRAHALAEEIAREAVFE